MKQKAVIVSILLALALASSALLLTAQAQFPSPRIFEGRSIIRWHFNGQSGIAIGKAMLLVREGPPYSPSNFFDIRLTVGGVNCYWLVSSVKANGDFLTIHGIPLSKDTPYGGGLISLHFSSPITIILHNVEPYSAIAFGSEVFFL